MTKIEEIRKVGRYLANAMDHVSEIIAMFAIHDLISILMGGEINGWTMSTTFEEAKHDNPNNEIKRLKGVISDLVEKTSKIESNNDKITNKSQSIEDDVQSIYSITNREDL